MTKESQRKSGGWKQERKCIAIDCLRGEHNITAAVGAIPLMNAPALAGQLFGIGGGSSGKHHTHVAKLNITHLFGRQLLVLRLLSCLQELAPVRLEETSDLPRLWRAASRPSFYPACPRFPRTIFLLMSCPYCTVTVRLILYVQQ